MFISIYKEGCGLKTRPDFLWDCDTHFLILEVDENQHLNYECDRPRMINISQALGMKTLFIRYNPDKFKVNGRLSKTSDNERCKQLIAWLKHTKETNYEFKGFCSYIELFFDGYKKSDKEIKVLL